MADASVVRIFATTQVPDYDAPWQAQTPNRSTGSGVIVDQRHVLTGAHVVANATFVQVQKVSDPRKYVARVTAVCHDCDLALLTVEAREFRAGNRPMQLGELPKLRDRVSVVGFPVGGQEVSVTEGVVSRIEAQRYSHSQRLLLAVTVDAAINDGNSGGPVFQDGRVVGIAFQTLSDADNIGEMVPPPLIRRFLQGVAAHRPVTIPSLSIRTQSLENPSLKALVGLTSKDSGILVRAVDHGGSGAGKLKVGDVLLEVDGHRVADNGTIVYQTNYRTSLHVLLGDRYLGDRLPVVIARGGRRRRLSLELQAPADLVPRSRYEVSPPYLVFGGLVLQVLSRGFLETWNEWELNAPSELIELYYTGVRSKERRAVVVLSHVLADEINVGYGSFRNESIVSVGGVMPRDLAHVSELLESARRGSGEPIELRTSRNGRLVFDPPTARRAHERILKRYRIHRDRSEILTLH